jgi:4-hydroxy-3-methylbut-2-enyl diphosphate reductase
MKLLLSKPRGFCAGVERAIETVEKALRLWGAPIYVKHEIVHNRYVVDDLRQKGAVFIEDLSDVPPGSRLIYSAHGVSPAVRDEAKKRQLIEIDATCGLVTRVHSAVKRYAALGYRILLIGHKNHVEIIGTAGEAPDVTTIIESVEDVEGLRFSEEEKLFYITQTTLSLDDVKEITEALVAKYPRIETLPSSSICYATTNRQLALREITDETDLVLVVGDPQSSNSNRLRELAEKRGVPSYLINNEEEIDPAWLNGVQTIGLTAGASTPELRVQHCIEKLIKLGVTSVEDVVYTVEDVVFQLPKPVLTALKSLLLAALLTFQPLAAEDYQHGFFDWIFGSSGPEDATPFNLENLENLEARLKKKIVGQDHAIRLTVEALQRYVFGLNNPNTPIASLLYIGPTGVGKSQLAKELAHELLGSDQEMIRLNLSEYTDFASIYRLIGTPPGIIYSWEGGQFTNALLAKPYAIVLLDEIDKAHPNVLKALMQLFEEGMIKDARNNLIDCRNMIFILTTNLASQKILTMHDLGHADREILKAIQPTMSEHLSPEFYNRLQPIIFRGLREELMEELILTMLSQAIENLAANKHIEFGYDPSLIAFLKKGATNYLLGARPLKQLISQTVMTAIAEAFKGKYLFDGAHVTLSFAQGLFILQKEGESIPFIWEWSDHSPLAIPPFNFNQLLEMQERLSAKILGQPDAVRMTTAALTRYAAGLGSTKAPIASFLFVGPTGVGKTQLAKELAAELFGSETQLVRLDMSEYIEPHSVARLIGSPPGYVNHEEGGQLTEALKKHPYSIVLLDEIEKAHPNVLKMFLQVFDEGRLSDAKGTDIDCRHSLFIMTTNITSSKILNMHEQGYLSEEIFEKIRPDLIKALSPELFNRLEVAVFVGISQEILNIIVHKMLSELKEEVYLKKSISLEFDESLVEFLKRNGFDHELGVRPLKRLIQQTIVTSLANKIMAENTPPGTCLKVVYREGEVIFE